MNTDALSFVERVQGQAHLVDDPFSLLRVWGIQGGPAFANYADRKIDRIFLRLRTRPCIIRDRDGPLWRELRSQVIFVESMIPMVPMLVSPGNHIGIESAWNFVQIRTEYSDKP